jgi:hypothetical protein
MLIPTLSVVPSPLWSHGPRPDPTITKPRHKNTARNRGLLPHNAPTRPLCTRPGLPGYIYTIPLPSRHSGTHHDTHLVQRERLKGITTPHTSDASRVNRKAPGHKIGQVALARPCYYFFCLVFRFLPLTPFRPDIQHAAHSRPHPSPGFPPSTRSRSTSEIHV